MAAGCAKAIIIIVNIVFTLIGLGLLAGGLFLRFGEQYYADELDKFQDQIPDIAEATGLDNVATDNSTGSNTLDLGSILPTMSIVLIVLGLFLTITGGLGMCGACCSKKWMLILYIIIVAILFIAKIAILAVLASGSFDDQIKDEMKTILVDDFRGIDDFSVKSISLNYVMLNYECCGVDGYQDFDEAENWNRNRSFTYESYTVFREMQTPVACCAYTGEFPEIELNNVNCTFELDSEFNNFEKGCWEEIKDELDASKIYFYAFFAVILGFELLCMILAGCIIAKTGTDKDDYA